MAKSLPHLLAATILAGLAFAFPAKAQEPQIGTCEAAYSVHLAGIAANELARLREASNTIDAVDPSLPGRLLIASPDRLRARSARETVAYDTARTLARRQGRTSFASNADGRWVAGRIREDLTDYLQQKPTPFLCAGMAPYLSILRKYAERGAPAPSVVEANWQVHQAGTARGIDALLAALSPVARPHFAPDDRPNRQALDGLRPSVEDDHRGSAETRTETDEPVRLASRGEGLTRVSEGQGDPDLPRLDPDRYRLGSDRDLMATLAEVTARLSESGYLELPQTGAKPATDVERPLLTQLSALERHLSAAPLADPLIEPLFQRVLSDIEAAHYLLAARNGESDELNAALHETMEAIERAHEQACTCAKP